MPEDISVPPGFKLRQILPGHDDYVTRLRWSHDGNIVASSAHDSTVRLWDFKSGELTEFYAHKNIIDDIAWSPDGRFLASAAYMENAKLWNIKDNKLQSIFRNLQSMDIAYSPDGRFIASYERVSYLEIAINILNAQTLEVIKIIPLDAAKHTIDPNPIRWSNRGEYLAVGIEEHVVYIYRTKDWGLYTVLNIDSPTAGINDVLWMPDDNTLLVASGDPLNRYGHKIDVWDVQNNRLITQLASHYAALGLSLSADKTLVASKSNDYIVRFWRCSDWSNVATLPVITGGSGMDFHPSLPIIALPYAEKEDGDFRIALWELDL